MAPSELARSAERNKNDKNRASLSTSSSAPSAPLSVLPTSKAQRQGKEARAAEGDGDTGVDKDTPMADSPVQSSEQVEYWSHYQGAEYNNNDDSHESRSYQRHGDLGDTGQRATPQRPRRPRIRSSRKYSSQEEVYNSTSPKHYPEVKFAKMDSNGETLYLSQNPSGNNRASSDQYQMHPPGYTSKEDNRGGMDDGTRDYNMNVGGGAGYYGGRPPPYQNGVGNNGAYPPHYPPYRPYPQTPYYYDAHGNYIGVSSNTTSASGLNVRGEEVGIVIVVLLLWVGAIILFFNRWGKIRMLEPYQPKFCESHRPSCPMAEVTAISGIPPYRERTFSKYNLSTEMLAPNGQPHFVKCSYHGIPTSIEPAPGFSGMTSGLNVPGPGFMGGGSTGVLNNHQNSNMQQRNNNQNQHQRPRQNSVFATSPSSQVNFYGSDGALKNSSRKTKSAVDLPTLVLSGEIIDKVKSDSKNSITQL